MMTINNKYTHGDIVFLQSDIEQKPRMVNMIQISVGGVLLYDLACAENVSTHYEFEIISQKDIHLQLGIESDGQKL